MREEVTHAMKLGVFTVLYQDLPLEAALDKVKAMGVQAVEIGTGNYPGDAHCKPAELLADGAKAKALKDAVESRDLVISALSQHGNPLHPREEVAAASHETWRKTVELANVLGVPVVNAFPGCPGDSPTSQRPNWVTCPWPPDFLEILEWQWNEKIVPYWIEEADYAKRHGVKIGFEMHPGMVVYNPETMLKLRDTVGNDAIGCNFDPSHLLWQGIDAIEAVKELGRAGAIVHAHAKDVFLDVGNIRRNGVLDAKPYGEILDRSWTFRTIGYGHPVKLWRDVVSALRAVGYDYVLSIEHEDALTSVDEGLGKAIDVLDALLLKEQPGEMWWA
jgi:sugar phosphate isomerase/epimerase